MDKLYTDSVIIGGNMQAKIIVELPSKKVDKEFIYNIPLYLDVKIGAIVRVPFGNRLIEGFVLDIGTFPTEYTLKEIDSIVNSDVLSTELIELGKYISRTTISSLSSAFQSMLPKGIKASIKNKVGVSKKRYMVLNQDINIINNYIDNNRRYIKQVNILNEVIDNGKVLVSRLDSSINTLLNKGLIKFVYEEEYRYRVESFNSNKEIVLSPEQERVIGTIKGDMDEKEKGEDVVKEEEGKLGRHNTYLLYGVTGSGKTEVYVELVKECVQRGRQAIVLVPEIGLTEQIVSRFKRGLEGMEIGGDNDIDENRKVNIAVLHSGLSEGERYDEYRRIKEKNVDVVIGTRSAIFAPLKNVGIIVIDEEQSTSYKQDCNPRYHARDVAIWRGKWHRCPVVLGSATPSLESFAMAGNGVYRLVTMLRRAGKARMPVVTVVDMKREAKRGNFILSEVLVQKMREVIGRGKQVMLLLNRRGYSSAFICKDCSHTERCPNCDITLTYHKSSNRFSCHYCGFSKVRDGRCSKCGSDNVMDYGIGTERLSEEVERLVDGARVVRMDLDTTGRKGSHQRIIREFDSGVYNVLVGTQMIAKGLDFPNVVLVGVVSADSSLNVPDFRSSERTFELLTQVSGRSGRGSDAGEVVVQSFDTEHYSLEYARRQDYVGFYREEMKVRKVLKYSPYYYIAVVSVLSKDYKEGMREVRKVGEYLRSKLDGEAIVLGPAMANVFKMNNVYRYKCTVKYRKSDKLVEVLTFIDGIYRDNGRVSVEVDVGPSRM